MKYEILAANQEERELGEHGAVVSSISFNGEAWFTDNSDNNFYRYLQSTATHNLNWFFGGLQQLISTREMVRESLMDCKAEYEGLVLNLDSEYAHSSIAAPALFTWSAATEFALCNNDFCPPFAKSLPIPGLTWTEILELIASSGSQVFSDLRSKVERLRGLTMYVNDCIGVVIRLFGRPGFDHTFVSTQKSFHILHGSHPPRHQAGLLSGRRSNLFGGCIQAISSIPV